MMHRHSTERCRALHLYRMGLNSDKLKTTKTYNTHGKRTSIRMCEFDDSGPAQLTHARPHPH